ncbi:MAG: helix-turn-helix transcriptional regulator [Leptolyngbya sp. SIO3F4]|nr:helix-turn-helix transcriptional regulator [Leptolyngbya sp. SIO3F4]
MSIAAFVKAIKGQQNDYLTMIFESFLGQLFPFQGLLLLNQAGQLMQSNAKARELCQMLHQAIVNPSGTPAVNYGAVPSQVTTLCKYLRNGRLEFPGRPLQLSEDIFLDTGVQIHLNAEWIELDGQNTPCILVRLEDVTQMASQRALCDAIRYGLTQREFEVWTLYLQGISYREIGDQLFITISTVKKHMKNVYSKRRGENI